MVEEEPESAISHADGGARAVARIRPPRPLTVLAFEPAHATIAEYVRSSRMHDRAELRESESSSCPEL